MMSFRGFIEKLERRGDLVVIKKTVSRDFEVANVLNAFEPDPVLFNSVNNFDFRIVGNLFTNKQALAEYFECESSDIIKRIIHSIENPEKPKIVTSAPCQEVIEDKVDLDKIPILFHLKNDGGRYITSGVVIVKDDELGQNISFHRCMQIGKDRFSIRILPRHLHEFIQRNGGEIEAALCIGCGANVLLAAATSVELGKSELDIAAALEPLNVVKCLTTDILVPADAEFVMEGIITTKEQYVEGPFRDLTQTMDIVREQPVFIVKKITHRKDAIWHALLPGGLEHKILMGTPREPTIFKEVNRVCRCLDVNINTGGCSWLHAIIQIEKKNEDDGKKAIEAAFRGHSSLKHAFVVDSDINIYDPVDVEWAMATRFQGDKDILVIGRQPGSSLDPSADARTRLTMKMGFDLTKPVRPMNGKNFEKVKFPKINKEDYI